MVGRTFCVTRFTRPWKSRERFKFASRSLETEALAAGMRARHTPAIRADFECEPNRRETSVGEFTLDTTSYATYTWSMTEARESGSFGRIPPRVLIGDLKS